MKALVVLFLAGCAPTPEQRCDRAIAALCDKQLECGRIASVRDCAYDYEELYVCDPLATQAQFAACTEAIDSSGCEVVQPGECSDLLCDQERGCDGTAPGCREPGATTTDLPVCGTGDTAAR